MEPIKYATAACGYVGKLKRKEKGQKFIIDPTIQTKGRKGRNKMTVKNYEELEAITIKDLKKEKNKSGIFKDDYHYYLIDLGEYYKMSLYITAGDKIILRELGLRLSSSYTTEEHIQKLFEYVSNKIFSYKELEHGGFSSYNDYKNKLYFIMNYLPETVNYRSCWTAKNKDNKNCNIKMPLIYGYFENEEEGRKVSDLLIKLESNFIKEFLANDELFIRSVRYELANHEYVITGDVEPALDALGLKWETLSKHHQSLVVKAANNRSY